jgi:hypothetical protein
MKGLVFWKRWLIAVSLLLIALGLGMVLLGFAPQKPSDDPVIEAFFGGNLPAGGTTAFFGWAFAVWGSTIVGWGLTLLFIARYPFARAERWAWWAIVASVALWYPIDTFASLAFGIPFNAALNTGFLVAVGVPLVATWRQFHRARGVKAITNPSNSPFDCSVVPPRSIRPRKEPTA